MDSRARASKKREQNIFDQMKEKNNRPASKRTRENITINLPIKRLKVQKGKKNQGLACKYK